MNVKAWCAFSNLVEIYSLATLFLYLYCRCHAIKKFYLRQRCTSYLYVRCITSTWLISLLDNPGYYINSSLRLNVTSFVTAKPTTLSETGNFVISTSKNVRKLFIYHCNKQYDIYLQTILILILKSHHSGATGYSEITFEGLYDDGC